MLFFLYLKLSIMHPSDYKPLTVLQNLIVINNERLEGYDNATKETDVSVLKVLFSRLTETSIQCREELCREVYKLGGTPPVGTTEIGDFDKAWHQIRSALGSNDHKALLDSCYIEEFMAYKSYEYALRYYQDHITSQHLSLFSKQKEMLKEDQLKVKNLRDVLHAA